MTSSALWEYKPVETSGLILMGGKFLMDGGTQGWDDLSTVHTCWCTVNILEIMLPSEEETSCLGFKINYSLFIYFFYFVPVKALSLSSFSS